MDCASGLEKKKTHGAMICYLCPETFRNVLDATNHLQSAHDKNNHGDPLQCMKRHKSGLFCDSKFNSIKALRKHMRDSACKLLSVDMNQDEINENSCVGWNQIEDIFGDLNFDEDKPSPEEEMHPLMEAHIKSFVNKLIISTLPHDLVDEIVNSTKELIARITVLNKELIKNNAKTVDAGLTLDSTEHFVVSQLNRFNTRYKRKLNCTESPHYVAPKTCSLNQDDTFQYVPILETLHKLFANEKFKNEYFAYNNEHQCREGVYERFCCGENFKESEFFQTNRNSIQIQIFFDDVQLTSPLKTSPHKVCGIYFIVRNFPPEFVSKLDNMYLISLCDSKIVEKHGCNSILEPFVRDLKFLETNGILIDGRLLKGTLVQVSFDNLGGNTIFGFTKGFNSTYYCRICICTIQQSRSKTAELVCKIRSKKHYEEQIMKISQSQAKLPLSETFGIANYCVLNDLNFYHIIDNRSQDIMHDIYEGAMPFILHLFFERLIEHKIITAKEIEEKITSFDYGLLERKNKPSKLCLSKKNLNQNASQMHCLMRHIPFIFVYLLKLSDESKKRLVHNIWPVIEYMLKIDQIVSSTEITEKDLVNLENYSQEFLKIITNKFKANLIPKLHFITHYANTIRKKGPLVFLQMMRGDAKHQPFTQYAKRCRNYINICKTLSEKHQEVLTAKWSKNIYCDSINVSKKMSKIEMKTGVLTNELENHSPLVYAHFEEAVNRVVLINSVTVNSFMFRKGLFIIFSNEMHQIDAILKCNDSFIFPCTKFKTSKFYEFANCFEIEKSTEVLLVELDKLECKRSYEAKYITNRIQIMADNLDMIPIYDKHISVSN